MSIEEVKEFYEKIASDDEFQNKLNELQDKATKGLKLPLEQDKKEEMVKDVIIPFAKEQGFDFSIEDIKEFEESIIEQLDEEQLKDISAGVASYNGAGILLSLCIIIGCGAGVGGGYNDGDGGYGGLCVGLGLGWGAVVCILSGGGWT